MLATEEQFFSRYFDMKFGSQCMILGALKALNERSENAKSQLDEGEHSVLGSIKITVCANIKKGKPYESLPAIQWKKVVDLLVQSGAVNKQFVADAVAFLLQGQDIMELDTELKGDWWDNQINEYRQPRAGRTTVKTVDSA